MRIDIALAGRVVLRIVQILTISAFAAAIARGALPPGADPALAPWFHELEQPGTGWLCCSVADCRPVKVRFANGRTEAFIARGLFRDGTDTWEPVPEEVVIQGHDNPVGEPVVCWFNGAVRCFVPPTGT